MWGETFKEKADEVYLKLEVVVFWVANLVEHGNLKGQWYNQWFVNHLPLDSTGIWGVHGVFLRVPRVNFWLF